ncbi:MAG: aldehyde dehydrogenase family protein [Candidatus Dormibacteria bacterium]
MTALPVVKTPKLYLGGAFVRSESGRVYQPAASGNVPRGSRKDLRDAVRAARQAQPGWAALSAYNRGQVIYRIAEMLEASRSSMARALGGGRPAARELDACLEALVFFAGAADKLGQMGGSVNSVAGPFFNFTVPEPVGVVFLVAGDRQALLPLVTHLAASVCAGNAAVALVSPVRPLPGLLLGESLQTGDLPPGTINLLSGLPGEILGWAGSHRDIDLVDCCGCDQEQWRELSEAAADSVKRVLAPELALVPLNPRLALRMMELKTVWHPVGV